MENTTYLPTNPLGGVVSLAFPAYAAALAIIASQLSVREVQPKRMRS